MFEIITNFSFEFFSVKQFLQFCQSQGLTNAKICVERKVFFKR